jgi:flagellar protein FlaG
MVQHIRPPQDPYLAQQQRASDVNPVRGTDSRVEVNRGTPAPVSSPTREDVEQAVDRVKEALRGSTSRVEFEINPALDRLNKVVIKILNGESGEVIRQIPSQELLDLAKHLNEPKGFLIHERA